MQVNLTGLSSIKRGMNQIVFEIVTSYTITFQTKAWCSHKLHDTQLFTTRVYHYIHLYVFGKLYTAGTQLYMASSLTADAPNLTRYNESDRTLVCNLQSGEMRRYGDFFVSFIREYIDEGNTTQNVTVGRCSSTDRHPLEHHGMRIYYNKTTECCVMELPATIGQQDEGTYYCDVKIRNAESNELIMYGQGTVMVDTIDPKPAIS